MVLARATNACISLTVLFLSGVAIADESDSTRSGGGAARFNRPHTLAVERVFLPGSLETPEPIRIKFEGFLLDQLRSEGFEVIPPDRFDALRAAVTDSMGGYFDAETGEADSVRFEAVTRTVAAAAHERLGADAIVKAGIGVTLVPFRGGPKIRWEGAEDNIGASGHGNVPAYSFVVLITGTDGSDIHLGSGGIQLAMKFRKKSLLSSDLVLKDVERKDLFTKEDKNRHAVRLALTPFAANEKEKD